MIVECQDCEAKVQVEVVASYETIIEGEGVDIRYSFCRCSQCSKPILVSQTNWFSTIEEDEPYIVYPQEKAALSHEVPYELRSTYNEASVCYKCKAFTATLLLCRKIIEGVCKEQKAAGGNLKNMLDDLLAKEVIDRHLHEWADMLRLSGNEAAHELNVRQQRENAKDILGFTEAILDFVYTYRKRFSMFKERRTALNGPAVGE